MKVVYFACSPAHNRALESFKDTADFEQVMVVPKPQITSNIVPEDHRDFGIKNIITYSDIKEADRIIKKLRPDILAQTFINKDIALPVGAKRVYISHGMVGNHVVAMTKRGSAKTWKGFDMYCGATEVFRDWVEYATGKEQNVILNAFPQLDLLSDKNYITQYRDNVLGITGNKTPSKVIMFCGFCCKQRDDFVAHNEDYFSTIIELERISRKYNFLTLVKPKQQYNEIIGFLKQNKKCKWSQKYINSYADIQASKYLHFITTTSHIYRYFFADLIICNGCSTIEIEACVTNKPLVLVRTKVSKDRYDPFDTVSSGAGIQVSNINDLENTILGCLSGNSHVTKQNALLKKFNITVDGKAYKRIQRAMVTL